MVKVLWFTNVVLPEAAGPLGLPLFHKCGWLTSYAEALRETGQVELTVVCGWPISQYKRVEVRGVHHCLVPVRSFADLRQPIGHGLHQDYFRTVREVAPDVVHFHGTEYHYGTMTADQSWHYPSVISVQGLMHACRPFLWGGMSLREVLQAHTLREIRKRNGLIADWYRWGKREAMENAIIRQNTSFIGRTRWDRAHLRAINSKARYFHCEELLRRDFYRIRREAGSIERFTIFTPTASCPSKGFHWLLRAVALLKEQFPEVRVKLADNPIQNGPGASGYQQYLRRLIKDLQLERHVVMLGTLDAAAMARELSQSHVYVTPSLVENRCNSLAEAMLVGTPAVVSLAGGMVSTVKDRVTALCFPLGDYAMLAECVRMLFTDDDLAARLAANAREVAVRRHDYPVVGRKLQQIYTALKAGTSIDEPPDD
jgi:glycosyltransferase involved in cell wall biosynthesis